MKVKNENSATDSAWLAAIVASSDDAIISKNLDGEIISWNHAAERIYGYTAAEAIGKPIFIIIPPDRRAEEDAILSRLRNGEKIEHIDTVRITKSGKSVDVSITVSPVRDQSGKIIGASKVARDITDRKRIEAELLKSQGELRKLNEDLERQVKLRTDEIDRQAARLRVLSNRLMTIRDEERRALARQLHEGCGQVAAAIGITFGLINRNDSREVFDKTLHEGQRLASDLTRELRAMSYTMHPPLLDELGVLEAIRGAIRELSEQYGMKISVDAVKDFGRLPGDLELALFRIAQEGLLNIGRHSGTKQASISLRREEGSVQLTIRDEGRGFDASRPGAGLTGMRERIFALGGVLEINSSEKGTELTVQLPISRKVLQGGDSGPAI